LKAKGKKRRERVIRYLEGSLKGAHPQAHGLVEIKTLETGKKEKVKTTENGGCGKSEMPRKDLEKMEKHAIEKEEALSLFVLEKHRYKKENERTITTAARNKTGDD